MQQRKKLIWYTTAAIVVIAAVTIILVRSVNTAALARELQTQHGIEIGYNSLIIRQTTFNEETLQCLPQDLSHITWFFVDTVTIQNEQAFSELIRRLSKCYYGQIVNSAGDSEFIFTQFGLLSLEILAI
jgi:thiosulfate reductase cytochrome b subunit